jgi:Ca2+-transporting ATPase
VRSNNDVTARLGRGTLTERIVFEAEPEEADVMRRPPRQSDRPLFSGRVLVLSLLQGACALLIVLTVFGIALYRQKGALDARALAFTTLIVANLGLIVTNRSWTRTIGETLRTPNPAARWVIGGAIVLLIFDSMGQREGSCDQAQ